MAISMGIVAGVRPGATLLQPVKPPSTLCILKNYVLICETVLIACIFVFGCVRLLLSQPWYTGGNGQADHVGGFAAVLLSYCMTSCTFSCFPTLQHLVCALMSCCITPCILSCFNSPASCVCTHVLLHYIMHTLLFTTLQQVVSPCIYAT